MSVAYVLDEIFLEHRPPGSHPECPERLVAIRDALAKIGLEQRARRLPLRQAREQELVRVHTAGYLADLERTIPGRSGWLDGDTYFSPHSWRAALSAAAGAIDVTDAVLQGDVRRGLVLTRPPGHHAEADRAMGFCLLNNIAAAAAAARAGGLDRVAILDWDVHHGNGTQHMFEDDPAVLYLSAHQFPFFPGTGAADEIGQGDGAGHTVNVALPAGCGDVEYAAVWNEVIEPALRWFDPQLILVSGGFDALADDPLAQMEVTIDGFRWLADRVCAIADDVCDGRLVCVLEGGYDLAGLGSSVAALFEAMTREEPAALAGASVAAVVAGAVASDARDAIHATIAAHQVVHGAAGW